MGIEPHGYGIGYLHKKKNSQSLTIIATHDHLVERKSDLSKVLF